MNNWIFTCVIFVILTLVSCGNPQKADRERDVKLAEKVYLGQIQGADIREICVIESNQRSVFPLPDRDTKNKQLSTREPELINKFILAFRDLKSKDDPLAVGFFDSFHILVIFESGEHAYLHGSIGKNGFIVQPTFVGNSIATKRNGVYNFLAENFGKTE